MSSDDLLDELLTETEEEEMDGEYSLEDEILAPLLSEINLISDPTIKQFARAVLLSAKNFWVIPSSFSGKYHPPDERGIGGNVLHTQRVVRIVALICDAQDRMYFEKDMMITAALIHDLMKGGEEDIPAHDHMHPYKVDWVVEQLRAQDEENTGTNRSNSALLDDDYVQQILRLVRCHLGRWSPVPETVPITTLEWALHLADLIAANLHTIADAEVNEKRWDA